jgi:hypothetical protein
MASNTRFARIVLPFLALMGKVSATTYDSRESFHKWEIDFKTFLQYDLDTTNWLSSQSIVAGLMAVDYRSDSGPWSDVSVTNKLDGAAAGSFLASLLIPSPPRPNHSHHNAYSAASTACRSLVDTDIAKALSGRNHSQHEVPRGTAGSSFVVGLSRALCNSLVPGFEYLWDGPRLETALNSSFHKLVSAHMTDVGGSPEGAAAFATQLEDKLRVVDKAGSVEKAFELTTRGLGMDTTTLDLFAALNTKSQPAIREYIKLCLNTYNRLWNKRTNMGLTLWQHSQEPNVLVKTLTHIAMTSLQNATRFGGKISISAKHMARWMNEWPYPKSDVHVGGYFDVGDKRALDPELRSDLMKMPEEEALAMRKFIDSLPSGAVLDFGYGSELASHAKTMHVPEEHETATTLFDSPLPSPTTATITQDAEPQPTHDVNAQELAPTRLSARTRPAFYYRPRPPGWPYQSIDVRPTATVYYNRLGKDPLPTSYQPYYAAPIPNVEGLRRIGTTMPTTVRVVTAMPTRVRTDPRVTKTVTAVVTTTATNTLRITKWHTSISTRTDYECKHGEVRQCHYRWTRLCWYEL